MAFKVGSFAKTTSAAPVQQTVTHNLGVTPVALILFGIRENPTANFFSPIMGFTDGATSWNVGAASANGQNPSDAGRNSRNSVYSKILANGTLEAQCSFVSWDGTDFVINWTSNTSSDTWIHYIILGGTGVEAAVVDWSIPTATGNHAVTGFGFHPQLVLHLSIGRIISGATTDAQIMVGAMDREGNEWVSTVLSVDNVSPSDTQSLQRTDACFALLNNTPAASALGSFVSMDGDGFTLNFPTVPGSAYDVYSLGIRGIEAYVGSFAKSTGAAPVSQAITGVGFTPEAVFLQDVMSASPSSGVAHSLFGQGAYDGTTQVMIESGDQNGQNPTNSFERTYSTTYCVEIVDPTALSTVLARAAATSLDTDGFTLNWSTNNAVAVEMLYLAMADKVPRGYHMLV